jgi:hypothetical protein
VRAFLVFLYLKLHLASLILAPFLSAATQPAPILVASLAQFSYGITSAGRISLHAPSHGHLEIELLLQWCSSGGIIEQDMQRAHVSVRVSDVRAAVLSSGSQPLTTGLFFRNGNLSAVSRDNRCIRFHAVSNNIVDSLTFSGIVVNFTTNRSASFSPAVFFPVQRSAIIISRFNRNPAVDTFGMISVRVTDVVLGVILSLPIASHLLLWCTQDTEPPVFSFCPDDVHVTATSGSLSAVATWREPEADDNTALESVISSHSTSNLFTIAGESRVKSLTSSLSFSF